MKKIFVFLILLCFIVSITNVYGQLTIGQQAKQTIKIHMNENGIAHVTHEVVGDPKTTQQVETVQGKMANLQVKDNDGKDVQFLTLEKDPIAIVLPPSNNNLIFITYDIEDQLVFNDGIWTWKWLGKEETNFYFPSNVDIIWINNNPIFIGDKGIRQHGGPMILQYIPSQTSILKEIPWENENFLVDVKTLSNINGFEFTQQEKRISFNILNENSFVTTIIPLKLLWDPYDVYVNGNQTLHSEYFNNGTHAWLGFKPGTSGTVDIVGTSVVPEFPLFIPLLLGIFFVLIIQLKNGKNFH